MASLGALGFIKGASATALDSIQQRQKEEAELRKAKMLEELRAATAKDLANFEDLLSDKKVDSKLSGFDGNFKVYRNAKGEEISRQAATAAEIEANEAERRKTQLSLEGAALDIENTKSTIASRARDDDRLDRVSTAQIGSYNRSGRDEEDDDDVTDMDRANELIYRYSKEVGETAGSNNISTTAIRSGAIELIRNSRTGEEAERKFLEFLNNYRTGRKKTDQSKRTSLDRS